MAIALKYLFLMNHFGLFYFRYLPISQQQKFSSFAPDQIFIPCSLLVTAIYLSITRILDHFSCLQIKIYFIPLKNHSFMVVLWHK